MTARKDDRRKSEQVEAARKWIEEMTKDRPEPRFGARNRTSKDTRSPGRLGGQRLLFEPDVQGRLWGVQGKEGSKE